MSKLALLGGSPLRSIPFPHRKSITSNDKEAADAVMDSGILSAYVGAKCSAFNGGEVVNRLENTWNSVFNCKYSVCKLMDCWAPVRLWCIRHSARRRDNLPTLHYVSNRNLSTILWGDSRIR